MVVYITKVVCDVEKVSTGNLGQLRMKIAIFKEDTTSVSAGFLVNPLSCSNSNLECWFLWRKTGKPEEKPGLRARPESTTNSGNPHVVPGRYRSRATLVRGQCSHQFANPSPREKNTKRAKPNKQTKEKKIGYDRGTLTAAWFAQLVERRTAVREPHTGPSLRVLK